MLTQDDMVPKEVPAPSAPDRRHVWWAVPLAVVGCLSLVVVLVAAVMPARLLIEKQRCVKRDASDACVEQQTQKVEFALVPADAEPVAPRLRIDGTQVFGGTGDVYFVTIRQPQITMLDWFITRTSPAARFMSYTDKYGDQTEEELLQSGQRQMTGAKDRAIYVALQAAGFPVKRKEGKAIVDYVICLKANAAGTKCDEEPPAAKFLQPDDVIVELGDSRINTLDDLGPVLDRLTPGDEVSIVVERNGERVKGAVKTILAPDEKPDRTIIGFSPVDTTTVDLPKGLTVSFSTGGIGGPSAGLAFTLSLIDEVTKGNLMGNRRIAVTGEIDIDGQVGAIGGLNSKAEAVRQVGVKYFLVPASQPDTGPDSVAAARAVVGDSVEIIPVATLEEALAVLVRLGGDPLPSVG